MELLAQLLQGRSIEDVMKEFGNVSRQMADNPMLQWLGPLPRGANSRRIRSSPRVIELDPR
jgi:hypothetical protein